uniref:Uncharacterized protein n=1 Tax=Octopus bimaculoides TaxID=37653 RepID=A0A0L8FKA2_OCTBM
MHGCVLKSSSCNVMVQVCSVISCRSTQAFSSVSLVNRNCVEDHCMCLSSNCWAVYISNFFKTVMLAKLCICMHIYVYIYIGR